MSTTVSQTKTVYTADTVIYDFLPEKYAAEQALIVAELNVLISCNWQKAINSWFTNVSDTNLVNALVAAQYQPFVQSTIPTSGLSGDAAATASANIAKGASMDVDGGSYSASSTLSKDDAQMVVQEMLHKILTSCGSSELLSYFKGDATDTGLEDSASNSVKKQFKNCLTALLNSTTTTPAQTNPLTIDEDKVETDLGGSGVTASMIPVTNAPTAKLQELVSGFAFVPVLNRLIAGGGFASGQVGAGGADPDTTSGANKFDMNPTASGESDKIDAESHLVFPVRIMFADDSLTLREGTAGDNGGKFAGHQDIDGLEYTLDTGKSLSADTTEVTVQGGETAYVETSAGVFIASAGGDYRKVGPSMFMNKSQIETATPDQDGVSFQLNIIFADSPNSVGPTTDVPPAV